ncbi:hypothetical protein F4820DRAFT_462250 [Hypoxylon rubiginosum]|uniref:Uncharacterized protein n=1 Tax=Hypoxylon rubiginosum TaxID=110542 RepID=A0ACB9YLA5_9PEZI|nr:hypothetical protein F4820DRAFT_462250 [Hypoxylon rubiginosum]
MFHKTAILALLFGALATAAPPSINALLRPRDACAADKSVGYCTALTYTDRTGGSSAPPTSGQCEDACRSILSDAGDWAVDFAGKPAGYRDEMVLGTCGFGVSRLSDTDTAQFSFLVHNDDMLDVIGESLSRFAGKHGGKVKADGTMDCSGHVVKWYVG